MSASPVRYGEHPKIPQDAVCSICGGVEQLITDHCHEHGWVRGIVCPRCNVYLALIDRLITPKAQDLLALITHAARCPDCPAIAIDDLSPTSSLRSLGGSRPSVLGRIKVRLSPEMHNRLVDMAERKRRSMNGQVEVYIEEGLARDENAISEGTKVRLINPPGTKFPYGAVGVAEEAPGAGGLFWVQFPQGRMHTRRSEVEIVRETREWDEAERQGQ